MTDDTNFDGRAERFQRRIYQGLKGRLRLDTVWQTLLHQLPQINGTPLDIWDAGGGLGQFSVLLAERGHRLTLSDVSADMLALATQSLQQAGLSDQIVVDCASIQQRSLDLPPQDMVLCHAVLEWVADPVEVLSALAAVMKPGASLSLTFYNRLSLIWMNVLKGNFNMVLNDNLTGHPGSFTPPNPLSPAEVIAILDELGLRVQYQGGVRLAFDYLSRELRDQRSEEDLLAIEQYLQQFPELAGLGRYYHMIVEKPLE